MICSKCGAEILQQFKFCPQCGATVSKTSEESIEKQSAMAVESKSIPNLIDIQAGTFSMGFNEFNRKVSLVGFAIGETPVTQKQYEYVMGKNPSKLLGENRPVESVNWCEALIYCNSLSMMQGQTPCYSIGNATDLSKFESSSPLWKRVVCNFAANGYRLPTEAEWEYAARGGKNSSNDQYAGGNDIEKVAWYGENSNISTHDVSTKEPNSLQLYDMCGNVAEWCWDYMGELPLTPLTNPQGPKIGSMHVKRGGSWLDDPQQCSVYFRSGSAPTGKSSNLGFRVCRTLYENVI
ncbi:MAG: SUMF1/EgtB/PvdO family nonheme iron enzyme [Treponema sp.]|nr:SUMF1/EgtB/PvdO family nonheme iron enzyme [Treponema sp.]